MQGVVRPRPTELAARHLALDQVMSDRRATVEAVTGLLLSDTLNNTLDSVPDGKAKRDIPERVVTASVTEMGAGSPSCT